MHETATGRQQCESLQHREKNCPALSTDSIERLPVYNKTALKNYKVSQEADDWCIPSKEPLDLSRYKVP
ncbi:hypothetical protein F7725_014611, partial [Dissostichus mawsoni]